MRKMEVANGGGVERGREPRLDSEREENVIVIPR